MSLPEPVSRRAFALGLAAFALSACTFRPVYGPRSGGRPGIAADLAAIQIAPIGGRSGQRLRNELIFRFQRGGAPAPALYRLETRLSVGGRDLIITPSGRATAASADATANYRLIRIADNAVLLDASRTASASFDRSGQSFANMRALQDAQDRAVDGLVEDIWTRVSTILATRT